TLLVRRDEARRDRWPGAAARRVRLRARAVAAPADAGLLPRRGGGEHGRRGALVAGRGRPRDARRRAGGRRAPLGHPHAGRARNRLLRALTIFAAIAVPAELQKATSGEAWLAAMLDTEAALARAESTAGLIPVEAANAIASSCLDGSFDLGEITERGRATGTPVGPLVAALR